MKFVLKWLINGAIVVAFLMYYSDATFWQAAIAATGLTILSYLIGDQLILRATNNFLATICDFALAALYFLVLTYMMDWTLSMGETLFLALLVGVAEWILHRYIFHDKHRAA